MNTSIQNPQSSPTPITLTPELVQEAINNSDGLIALGLAPRTMKVERAREVLYRAAQHQIYHVAKGTWTRKGHNWLLVETMRADVRAYVAENEQGRIFDAIERAEQFLDQMFSKSMSDDVPYQYALRTYFTDPTLSTIHLRDKLLKPLGFDFNNLVDFNAFALLDSAHAHGRQRRGITQ